MERVCIVGISGKLGQYMVEHALARGYQVSGVCRAESVSKLAHFHDRITVYPGRTDDRHALGQALVGCQGVLVVLVPWGTSGYASATAQAVLDLAPHGARVVFSCGWHISHDGQDVYPFGQNALVATLGWMLRMFRVADIEDQVRACKIVFESEREWTVVRGPDLKEGQSEGLPVWSHHVGDPVLKSNLVRRTDFAMFMVHALTDDALRHQAPAIVGCKSKSSIRFAVR